MLPSAQKAGLGGPSKAQIQQSISQLEQALLSIPDCPDCPELLATRERIALDIEAQKKKLVLSRPLAERLALARQARERALVREAQALQILSTAVEAHKEAQCATESLSQDIALMEQEMLQSLQPTNSLAHLKDSFLRIVQDMSAGTVQKETVDGLKSQMETMFSEMETLSAAHSQHSHVANAQRLDTKQDMLQQQQLLQQQQGAQTPPPHGLLSTQPPNALQQQQLLQQQLQHEQHQQQQLQQQQQQQAASVQAVAHAAAREHQAKLQLEQINIQQKQAELDVQARHVAAMMAQANADGATHVAVPITQDGSLGPPVILRTPERSSRARSGSRSPYRLPGATSGEHTPTSHHPPRQFSDAPMAFNIGDDHPHVDGMFDFVAEMSNQQQIQSQQVPQSQGLQ